MGSLLHLSVITGITNGLDQYFRSDFTSRLEGDNSLALVVIHLHVSHSSHLTQRLLDGDRAGFAGHAVKIQDNLLAVRTDHRGGVTAANNEADPVREKGQQQDHDRGRPQHDPVELQHREPLSGRLAQ